MNDWTLNTQKSLNFIFFLSGALTQTPTHSSEYTSSVHGLSFEKIQRRVRSGIYSTDEVDLLSQAIQEAYNDFKHDLNNNSRQVTLFYHKFRRYEIKLGQPHLIPSRRKKKKREILG